MYKSSAEVKATIRRENACSMTKSFPEISYKSIFIIPDIGSFAIWKSIYILTLVRIFIGKLFLSPAMLQKVFKRSFVSLLVISLMNSFSLDYSLDPFSHIAVAFWRSPNSDSVLLSFCPLSLIDLSIFPYELSFSVAFIFLKSSLVLTYRVDFYTFGFLIIFP